MKEGKWDFRMLAVADRLCPRARLPREGSFTHLSEFKVPWMSTTGGGWQRKPTAEELTTMKYRPEDLGPGLDVHNAEVTVYHMWDESVVGIARHDTENHVLTFSNPGGHPPGAFGVKQYVVWNVREGLTQPGQWYLDRTAGKVVYWPLPGEDMAAVKTLAPTVESILRIRGQDVKPVRDVTIRGLTLAVSNTPLVAGGFGAGNFPGAVELTRAENCRLVGLEIKNVAGQGIRAGNLKACLIEDCHVHDTGACGLKFGGECTVRNNHVHHVGRIYPSGIAVWGGGRDGQTCQIEHNTIHDTPYTALACGGDDHRIEDNRIYQAMQVLHDGAGIYITFCKRVVVRGNYIHDIVDTGGYGASAYYLDEQAEDCLVEDNLSVRVARPSHNHMARKKHAAEQRLRLRRRCHADVSAIVGLPIGEERDRRRRQYSHHAAGGDYGGGGQHRVEQVGQSRGGEAGRLPPDGHAADRIRRRLATRRPAAGRIRNRLGPLCAGQSGQHAGDQGDRRQWSRLR